MGQHADSNQSPNKINNSDTVHFKHPRSSVMCYRLHFHGATYAALRWIHVKFWNSNENLNIWWFPTCPFIELKLPPLQVISPLILSYEHVIYKNLSLIKKLYYLIFPEASAKGTKGITQCTPHSHPNSAVTMHPNQCVLSGELLGWPHLVDTDEVSRSWRKLCDSKIFFISFENL